MTRAEWSPATTAKRTPSLMAATAAAVACRAARIFLPAIDPDVSTAMISTRAVAPGSPGRREDSSEAPDEVTAMTALTSPAPLARYSFWKHPRLKSGISLLLGEGTGRDRLNPADGGSHLQWQPPSSPAILAPPTQARHDGPGKEHSCPAG